MILVMVVSPHEEPHSVGNGWTWAKPYEQSTIPSVYAPRAAPGDGHFGAARASCGVESHVGCSAMC